MTQELIEAINSADIDKCKLLLERGVDVNKHSKSRWLDQTSLMCAAFYGRVGICDILIQAGARVNERNRDGETALMLAVISNSSATRMSVCRLLIQAGADVNIWSKDSWRKTGRSALSIAAECGYMDVCQLLIEAGADIDTRNSYGYTALMEVVGRHGICLSQLFIDNGADVNARDDDGRTALMHALSQRNNIDVCELLLASGADVNAQSSEDWTALTVAAMSGCADICQLLIETGADVNAQCIFGWTALMYAIGSRGVDRFRTCAILLSAGAYINARDKNGNTVLSLSQGYPDDVCQLLIKAGANPFTVTIHDGQVRGSFREILHKARRDATLFQRAVWFIQQHIELYDYTEIESAIAPHLWHEYFAPVIASALSYKNGLLTRSVASTRSAAWMNRILASASRCAIL